MDAGQWGTGDRIELARERLRSDARPEKPRAAALCVDFRIVHGDCSGRPCAVIWGKILVGTLRDRMTGGPEFWGMMLLTGSAYDYKGFDAADSLSELPRLLEKLKRY